MALLYLNENIAYTIKPYLKNLGINCIHTLDAQNQGTLDEPQLEYASKNGHVLVTHNRKDFRRLHRDWLSKKKSHAGIILLSPQTPDLLAHRLKNFIETRLPGLKSPFCELAERIPPSKST